MTKQSKNEKPVAVTPTDHAPIIPFMPYTHDERFEPPFSNALKEKSNALATSVWNNQTSYDVWNNVLGKTFAAKDVEESEVVKKNHAHFQYNEIHEALYRIFSLTNSTNNHNNFSETQKVNELIAKLERLERRGKEVIDDETRDDIVNTILLNANNFSPIQTYYPEYINFYHPACVGVVNGLITNNEMETLTGILNFIPRMRNILKNYRSPQSSILTTEMLLKPIVANSDSELLQSLFNINSFFEIAIPYKVKADFITSANPSGNSFIGPAPLYREASKNLRDVSYGFIQGRKLLSELLKSIVNLVLESFNYFTSMAVEIKKFFNYLNQIDVSYETLVIESTPRINGGTEPW